MKLLSVKDIIEFDNFDCVGVVLKKGMSNDVYKEISNLISFSQAYSGSAFSEPAIVRSDMPGPGRPYEGNPTMYLLLVGNHKGWMSHPELESVLDGGSI